MNQQGKRFNAFGFELQELNESDDDIIAEIVLENESIGKFIKRWNYMDIEIYEDYDETSFYRKAYEIFTQYQDKYPINKLDSINKISDFDIEKNAVLYLCVQLCQFDKFLPMVQDNVEGIWVLGFDGLTLCGQKLNNLAEFFENVFAQAYDRHFVFKPKYMVVNSIDDLDFYKDLPKISINDIKRSREKQIIRERSIG